MATPDGLVEARRAVLRAARDLETWDALAARLDGHGPRDAVAQATHDARNGLWGLLVLLGEAQADADNDEADQRTEGTDDP